MNRITKWVTLLVGSTLIAAAALGAVVVVGLTNARAQVETPKISSEIEFSAGEPESQHWPGGTRPNGRRPGGRGPGGRGSGGVPGGNQELADALDIPLEDLQEAQEAARLEAAEIALEAGDITEEQYDRMKAMQEFKDYFDKAAVTEAFLGISIEELKEAQAEGKRLPDILDELGLEASDLRETMEEAFNDAVQEALNDGVIDEEMAEQMQDKPLGGRSQGNLPGRRGGVDGRGPKAGDAQIDFQELLADELNISVEELQEALEETRQARQERALEDGRITEEQLELMEARKALNEYLDRDAILEGVLGMSKEELQEALGSGKRMPEILDELGLDPADLREAIQQAFEDALEEAVEDGVIDEDQAEMLKNREFGGRMPFGPGNRPGTGGFDNSPPMRDQSPSDTDTNL